MPEVHLSIHFRVLVLLAGAVCSVAVTLFIYRRTVPPVSTGQRLFLIALRSLGLFLLILLLGEPILDFITHTIERPVVAVLIDDSQSMTLADRTGERGQTLKSILHSDIWKKIGQNGIVKYFLFNSNVKSITSVTDDSLKFKGEATDIAKALKSIKQLFRSSNLQAVTVLTDGNSTTGMNPLHDAQDLVVPVFTVGVGDTVEQKDLLIRNVLTNEIAYAGTKVPVNVTMHSTGYGGERVMLSLRNGAAVLDEKSLTLDSGTRDYLVPLSVIAEKEGIQQFTAEVPPLPGELTLKNNRFNFSMKILKSKMRVALVAGSPSQDVTFIRRALSSDKNNEILPFIEKQDGKFYEQALPLETLKSVDCLVLVGYPTSHSSSSCLQAVEEAARLEKPLLIILSRTIDYNKLRMLDAYLPFSVVSQTGNEMQIFAAVPEAQQNNVILKVAGTARIIDTWSHLPPIFRTQGIYQSKVESEILATIRFQSTTLKEPLILSRNVNKKKSLAVLGYGVWRWTMLSDAGSGYGNVLDNFLGNAVRWLTTQEDARRIRVQPSKNAYTMQDAIEFLAQVYDENYQPIDDAQIEVRAQRDNETGSMTLHALGNGQYQGEFESLGEGGYSYTATVSLNGSVLGNDQGAFSVGGLHAEFLETRMNKSLLQQIAEQTGGRYYDSDRFQSLPEDLTALPAFMPRDVSRSTELEIWNARWILALVLLIFAFEWFLRKRHGML
jgi:hypothetical protein